MQISQYGKINNTNFSGSLYSHFGHHISKPIHCCKHGDWKFVEFINEIASKNVDSFDISIKEKDKTLIVHTKELPELSLKEKICFIVTPIQNKALTMRKQGKIDYFTYKISEKEYQKIKKEAHQSVFCKKKLSKVLDTFETLVRMKIAKNERFTLDKIIY